MSAAPKVVGLMLAGGKSRRMGEDKAAMVFRDGQTQLEMIESLLSDVGVESFLSVRADQDAAGRLDDTIVRDAFGDVGPLGALASAQAMRPDVAWLVVACDLPMLSKQAVEQLLADRTPSADATFFSSRFDGRPEPLCAIWEPSSAAAVRATVDAKKLCARHLLEDGSLDVVALTPDDPTALDNANTPEEADAIRKQMAGEPRQVIVRYFGVLGAEAGMPSESLATSAASVGELFAELKAARSLVQDAAIIRAAVNDEFVDWAAGFDDGADIAFMPPFAGG